MKQILQKTVSVHITFISGHYMGISGKDFTVEIEGERITFSLDLSGNLRARNKASFRVIDAHYLIEHNADVKIVQVFSGEKAFKTLSTLKPFFSMQSSVFLRLAASEGKSFIYPVTPKCECEKEQFLFTID